MSCHKNTHFIDAHSDETALDMVCFGLLQNVLNWNCLVVMLNSFLKIFCINHDSLNSKRAKESKEYNKISCWQFIVLCNRACLLWFWYIYNVYYLHQAIEENEIKDGKLIKISIFEYENEQNRISTDFLCA